MSEKVISSSDFRSNNHDKPTNNTKFEVDFYTGLVLSLEGRIRSEAPREFMIDNTLESRDFAIDLARDLKDSNDGLRRAIKKLETKIQSILGTTPTKPV